jgi:hypothetical protein
LNSAYIWIFLPGLVAVGLLLLQKRETLVAILGTLVTAGLAALAAWLPVQEQIFIHHLPDDCSLVWSGSNCSPGEAVCTPGISHGRFTYRCHCR